MSSKTLAYLQWGYQTLVNYLHFQTQYFQIILLNPDLFPKMIMDILLTILMKYMTGMDSSVTNITVTSHNCAPHAIRVTKENQPSYLTPGSEHVTMV